MLTKQNKTSRRSRRSLRLETFEDRLAPASALAFTDVDGDQVVVTSTRGDLTGTLATFADAGVGKQLQALNLTAEAFQGTAIATRVTRALGGDGLVNIGRIDAAGRDLASVVVKGDLGAIHAGDSNLDTPALRSLSVWSMGLYGLATQDVLFGNLTSNFLGSLGALRVAGDVREASVVINGGSIGSGVIGGSLVGGTADVSGQIRAGQIGTLTVRGDLRGGHGMFSGLISAGQIGALTVGGDLRGGHGDHSGRIGAGQIGALTVGGSVVGGGGHWSGRVQAPTLGAVMIRGDLAGGAGESSGSITSNISLSRLFVGGSVIGGAGTFSGSVDGYGLGVGPVHIGGDIRGGTGDASATVQSHSSIASVAVRGSVIGGNGIGSGRLGASDYLGPVSIGGNLAGGSGTGTGQITATAGTIAALRIRGSFLGGSGVGSGQVSVKNMGPVSIGGDLAGGSGAETGKIIAATVASLSVRGSILGGTTGQTGAVWVGEYLGPVRIGRDLRGGSSTDFEPWFDGSGYIYGGRIAGVYVGGSVVSGLSNPIFGPMAWNASIRAANDLGPVVVRGNILGNSTCPVVISARGQAEMMIGATTDLAIRSLTVGGRVEWSSVLAGYDADLTPVNGNASIGAVSVGGDWIASNLVAGVQDSDINGFGTAEDTVINDAGGTFLARIASIAIGGSVAGTVADGGDHFGFVAEQIGSFRAGAFVVPMAPTAEVIELPLITGDVTVREL